MSFRVLAEVDFTCSVAKTAPSVVRLPLRVKLLLPIPTREKAMLVNEKGQVTIPKHIRDAAAVAPGSEVTFSLEGSKIVISLVGTRVKEDRRDQLKAAAARVRGSLGAEFRPMGADEIMRFIRGDDPADGAA
ncbi:MAG: AbrB/MazE/SpoVT family DNA-binding domain-containing protein [Methyloversatilis sp.]|uniref:AbrB/MazE/SpoVT family DNA-binding domain-containing protein n=1 Tax=Methyloversatilis sp. TaxID=2569862 RepID=UPI0027327F52|nr:AbrB/MazE/SpoVT family DNA-binding domain-containing protein [Methyloversatilis sp.]MDP3872591.1 AbrB/MazE/SpoVT family DNA-binding domain-containing protein [Methyloversatilis sp.]